MVVVEVEYLFTPVCLLHNHLHFSLEFVGNLFRYPWHASCKIEWQFPQSCSTVRGQIVGQINAWEVSEGHHDIWHLILVRETPCVPAPAPAAQSSPVVRTVCTAWPAAQTPGWPAHTPPPWPGEWWSLCQHYRDNVLRYVDDISFKFSENSQGCAVSAKSSSQTW